MRCNWPIRYVILHIRKSNLSKFWTTEKKKFSIEKSIFGWESESSKVASQSNSSFRMRAFSNCSVLKVVPNTLSFSFERDEATIFRQHLKRGTSHIYPLQIHLCAFTYIGVITLRYIWVYEYKILCGKYPSTELFVVRILILFMQWGSYNGVCLLSN